MFVDNVVNTKFELIYDFAGVTFRQFEGLIATPD